MKRITFAFATWIVCSAGIATAQTGKLELGLQGGAGITSLWGNDALKKSKQNIGFSGGLFVQYNLLDDLAIRIDPGFERKGSLMKAESIDQNGNSVGRLRFNTNLNYLTVPVLVRYYFGNKTRFFANAGPYAAYLLDANQVTRGDKYIEMRYNNLASFNRWDFGITLGAGVTTTFYEKFTFSAEIRNNLGVNNISSIPVASNGKIKTNNAGLLVGLAWKI